MWMRLLASPSMPSTPSAPPSASGMTGSRRGSIRKSPISRVSTGTTGTDTEPVAPRNITGSAWIGLDPECLRQVRRQRGMAGAGGEHETERPLAVDRDRRPDAADLVAARGRDETGFVAR